MEPQAALVRADRAVHLDAEAAVDLHVALVVLPRHAEHHHPLGLDHPLEDLRAAVLGTTLEHEVERLDDFLHGLMELRLAGFLALRSAMRSRA